MGQLQVTSERWAQTTDASALSEVEESGTGGRRRVTQRRTHIHTSARGEATVSPAASELFVAGRPSLLTVGSTLYLYSPEPRGVARARPWVRSAVPSLADVTARYPCGGDPSHEVSLGGSGAYAGLINLLATALAPIRVAGPVLVDGRQTTEFLAEVEPLALAKGLTAKQRADIHAHLGSERIEVFITEAGLPVRVVELTTSGSLTARSTVDILATNIPLHIGRPPLRRTRRESKTSSSSSSSISISGRVAPVRAK